MQTFDPTHFQLSIYSIPTFLTMGAILLLGVAALVRERISLVSVSFFLLTLSVGVWLFAMSWMYSAGNESQAHLWAKFSYRGIPFIASSTYLFTVAVLGIYQRYKYMVWAGWLLSALFASAAFWSDALVSGVYSYPWGYYVKFGWLGVPFVAFFIGLFVLSMAHYWFEHRASLHERHKRRTRALMIAFAIGYIGSVDFIPSYGLPLYPFGYLAVLGFVAFAARALWVYRFVDVTPAYAAKEIIATMTDGLLVLDRDGIIRVVNRPVCEFLGCTEAELVGKPLSSRVDYTLVPGQHEVSVSMQAGKIEACEGPYCLIPGRDRVLSLSVSVMRDKQGNAEATVCIAHDITDRKRVEERIAKLNEKLELRVVKRTAQLESVKQGLEEEIVERKRAAEQLAHLAFHDVLTGLPSRALLMDRLGCAIERAKRDPHYSFATLFLDLDRFKNINDSLGHSTGDQLLVVVAHRLGECLRATDTVARLGGDEFAILLDDTRSVSGATIIAERILSVLGPPVNLNGQSVFTSASIGIAMSETTYTQPEEPLRDADTAMYRAKANGRARYELFNAEMHASAVALLQLEVDLRHAIERQEFFLHYQPIVSLEGGKIIGFEALVRWQHPDRGLVSPNDFIPMAEEMHLITDIDLWVLSEACHQMRAWQEQSNMYDDLTMSVNLSSGHFSQPGIVEHVHKVLRNTGLAPNSLRLEITEEALMKNSENATKTISQLNGIGVRSHLDDFGTGYSSLSYLHRFPFDALKIDRSFISRMDADTEASEIVRTIVDLARNLHMEVIAEGVETVEQLNRLKALECQYAQGFLFSKPVNAADAARLIAAQPKSHLPYLELSDYSRITTSPIGSVA